MSSVHPVKKYAARKGELRELHYKDHYEKLGYHVRYNGVNANGVDLVCYKKAEQADEFSMNGEPYEEDLLIFEITNWKKDSWMSLTKFEDIASNLRGEQEIQEKLHPKAVIRMMLVVSYTENLRYVMERLLEEEVYLEVLGFDEEPPPEEEIQAWQD